MDSGEVCDTESGMLKVTPSEVFVPLMVTLEIEPLPLHDHEPLIVMLSHDAASSGSVGAVHVIEPDACVWPCAVSEAAAFDVNVCCSIAYTFKYRSPLLPREAEGSELPV